MQKFQYSLWIVFLLSVNIHESIAQQSANAAQTNGLLFSFEKQLRLPGSPEQVYDKFTGNIRPWWDHAFAKQPDSLYIDARPGGGFYELFDKQGNGVRHAEVIYAHRGKLLRLDGPLGLSGLAVSQIMSFHFSPIGADSTLLRLELRAAGDFSPDLPGIVERVWEHFLFQRFGPYVRGTLK